MKKYLYIKEFWKLGPAFGQLKPKISIHTNLLNFFFNIRKKTLENAEHKEYTLWFIKLLSLPREHNSCGR